MSGPFGIRRGEDIAAYHQNEAVSSTRLMDLRPCPLTYYMKHVAKTLPREEKDCFDVGTGAHLLILEGRKALEQRTVVQPATYPAFSTHKEPQFLGDKPWNNNAKYCDTWNTQQRGAGLVVLTADELATIERMAAAVGENPDAATYLSGGHEETTFRKQHPAFAVQCRADMWHPTFCNQHPVCVDLKTCDTIERFRGEYFKLRYYYRAAFYQDVIEQVVGERPAFVFVAVEKSAPWRCEVFEPSESDLELGRNEMLADLKTLRGCVDSGIWPGSKMGVQPIELKGWQREESEKRAKGLYVETEAA